MTSETKHRLIVPGTFWWDHYDRCGDHDGERTVIREGKTVVVELDDEALANLKNDAEYYSDPNGPNSGSAEGGGLKRSAKLTLAAIARQLPDWKSPWDKEIVPDWKSPIPR